MNAKNIGAFIPGLNGKNMTNRASEGAIEKNLNTDRPQSPKPEAP